jgi:hypothetical protein
MARPIEFDDVIADSLYGRAKDDEVDENEVDEMDTKHPLVCSRLDGQCDECEVVFGTDLMTRMASHCPSQTILKGVMEGLRV